MNGFSNECARTGFGLGMHGFSNECAMSWFMHGFSNESA